MTRLLFWNVGARVSETQIADVAAATNADIVALAESSRCEPSRITAQLCIQTARPFQRFPISFTIAVYTSLPLHYIHPVVDDGRLVLLNIDQVLGASFILGFVHLQSKQSGDTATLATRFRPIIEKAEAAAGHSRTLLMGDFNMNPYDLGMVSSEAFHATMSRSIAAKRSRIVGAEPRHFFYNPMWNLMGDSSPGPPGTFYYDRSGTDSIYWHMLDQVLLRPDALEITDLTSLRIVTETRTCSLATRTGRPQASDHFPLFIATRS